MRASAWHRSCWPRPWRATVVWLTPCRSAVDTLDVHLRSIPDSDYQRLYSNLKRSVELTALPLQRGQRAGRGSCLETVLLTLALPRPACAGRQSPSSGAPMWEAERTTTRWPASSAGSGGSQAGT